MGWKQLLAGFNILFTRMYPFVYTLYDLEPALFGKDLHYSQLLTDNSTNATA